MVQKEVWEEIADSMHTAIFGPGKHGKTTLARYLSRKNFRQFKRRSICLDPWAEETQWGDQATVFQLGDNEAFWRMVWSTQGNIIFLDEGYSTIGRNPDLIPAFTEIRHRHHILVVIGHRSKQTLLPIMRDQIEQLFLFRQTKKSVEDWVEDFADENIRQAIGLPKYKFLHAVKGGTVRITSLTDQERAL